MQETLNFKISLEEGVEINSHPSSGNFICISRASHHRSPLTYALINRLKRAQYSMSCAKISISPCISCVRTRARVAGPNETVHD